MTKSAAIFLLVLFSSAANASKCDVSLPGIGDLPDSMLLPGVLWVGTEKLAARVPKDGGWNGMGPEHNYRDKWWWWREGYRAIEEAQPELSVTAKRLDGPAPMVIVSDATNALGVEGHDLMLLMMEFPTAGCWEVVGKYNDQELRFVFKVGE